MDRAHKSHSHNSCQEQARVGEMCVHSWHPVPPGKYLARVDTCCFCLPSGQAWLLEQLLESSLGVPPFPLLVGRAPPPPAIPGVGFVTLTLDSRGTAAHLRWSAPR